jgi:DNA-binding transcriptional LysR family regulator
MAWRMDVHQLNLFLAVIECSSVTRAAKRVNLSPGAVSLQIRNLASELQTELFVRSGKRLIPTPASVRLAEHAKAVSQLMNHILQDFESDPSSDKRPFYFATGGTTLIYQLSGPLQQLRKRLPNADIRVSVGATEQIVIGLIARRLDLGLISLPVMGNQLKLLPLFDEELLLLRESKEKTFGSSVRSIAASDLVDVPFLLYPKTSNVRQIIDRFFKEIGIIPRVQMEVEDTEVIKGLVAAGFGYSILPEHALPDQSPHLETLRVCGHHLKRSLALASVNSIYPRKLTGVIANFLQEYLRDT